MMTPIFPSAEMLNKLIDHARESSDLPERIRDLLGWCGGELTRLAARVESLEDRLADEIERLQAVLDGLPAPDGNED